MPRRGNVKLRLPTAAQIEYLVDQSFNVMLLKEVIDEPTGFAHRHLQSFRLALVVALFAMIACGAAGQKNNQPPFSDFLIAHYTFEGGIENSLNITVRRSAAGDPLQAANLFEGAIVNGYFKTLRGKKG